MQRKVRFNLFDFDGVITPLTGSQLVFSIPYRTVCSTRDLEPKLEKAFRNSRDIIKKSSGIEEEIMHLEDIVGDCIYYCSQIPELKQYQTDIEKIHEWDTNKLDDFCEVIKKLIRENNKIIDDYEERELDDNESDHSGPQAPTAAYNNKDNLDILLSDIDRLKVKQKSIVKQRAIIEEMINKQQPEIVYEKMAKISNELSLDEKRALINARSIEILANIEKFYPSNPEFKMTPETIDYIKSQLRDDNGELLSKANAHFHILSKNHQEFMQAVLLWNGFTHDEIACISFHDYRNGGSNKPATSVKIVSFVKAKFDIDTVIICDDTKEELKAMTKAATSSGWPASRIHSFHAEPGKFDFKEIARQTTMAEPASVASKGMFGSAITNTDDALISPRTKTPKPGTSSDGED